MRSIFNPSATKRITCPFDTDETKSVFVISLGLPVSVRQRIKDDYAEYVYEPQDGVVKTSVKYQYTERNNEIVKYGLKGLENFFDVNGNPVVLNIKNGVISEETLQALDVPLKDSKYESLIDWLAGEIWFVNTTTESELKN
jgi:hypothetical protein